MNKDRHIFWKNLDKSLIPHKPGVYIYKNKHGQIIYVGKAIDLYHRVASYFLSSHHTNAKLFQMVSEIADIETIVVLSEIEALVLEANLIKKYLPPYNIKLTDDKDYLYIKITKEDFPKIQTARKNELQGVKEYFGPFPSGKTVRQTLKKLRKIFPWCGGSSKKGKACFYYHLGLCPGSCVGKITQSEYKKRIRLFSKFMQGKKEEVVGELQKEMALYAKNLEFEKAQSVKKTIDGLIYLTETNNIQVYLENPNFVENQTQKSLESLQKCLGLDRIPHKIECFDISNIQGKDAVGSLVVLTDGEVDKKWFRRFKISFESGKEKKPNDVLMMRQIISRRLKHLEWPKPDLILVDGGKAQVGGALQELKLAEWKIPLFGLAKRNEWLVREDYSIIKLPRVSPALRMLQKIRDEAHRFAVTYHRKIYKLSLYN